MPNKPEPDDDDSAPGAQVKTKPKLRVQKPSMYKVFLLNDDFTPMEFVVDILKLFFNKNPEDAVRIMMLVHQSGVGLCGVYTYEVAETKVAQVLNAARGAGHPLQCTIEKA